jgi:dolichol-phosphate mannosyltransferase
MQSSLETSGISVVVALYNEEECIDELADRLTRTLAGLRRPYQVLFVDDGSTDASWRRVQAIVERLPGTAGLKLSRNFGHHYAISAGLDHVRGAWVVLMDADLQDSPEEIPRLLAKAEQGYDVVVAARLGKRHSLIKRALSYGFSRLMTYLTGAPYSEQVGIFRIMSRRYVDQLCKLRETSRYIVALANWVGFRQTMVPVQHAARFAGQTKYPIWRQIRLASHAALSSSDKPLKICVMIGLLFALSGFIFAAQIIVRALLGSIAVLGYASTISAILLVGGVGIATTGLVGLYVGRIYEEVKRRPLYVVEEVIGAK